MRLLASSPRPSPNFPAKREGRSGSGREQEQGEAGYCSRVPQSARKRDFRLERHSNWKIHILVRGRGHHRQRGADGPFPSPPRLRADSESELIFLSLNPPTNFRRAKRSHHFIKALESRCRQIQNTRTLRLVRRQLRESKGNRKMAEVTTAGQEKGRRDRDGHGRRIRPSFLSSFLPLCPTHLRLAARRGRAGGREPEKEK